MKILLTGASGLIGSALLGRLQPEHDCRTLTLRQPFAVPPDAIEWADAIISLNGATLSRVPWTADYRRQIAASRINITTAIAAAIAVSPSPPSVWLAASAVGVYGDRGEDELSEDAAPGRGFLAEVTKAWEQATSPASDSARVVNLRTGLVIAESGALKPLLLMSKLGLGARLGSGSAWWPWVSLADEVGGIIYSLDHDQIVGPVNLVGPTPARSGEVTAELANAAKRPYLMRLPAPVLHTLLGQAADELLLASQKVVPAKLLRSGYSFVHDAVATAIAAHDQ